MKKIFLALAAVAALAACSKTEYDEDLKEISLVAVPQNITKAMITGESMPRTDLFNVWAWYKQLDPTTSIAEWQADGTDNQWYVEEKPFGYRHATNNWGGVTPYYWPKLGSLLFAGYYPVDIKNSVEYFFTATDNRMVFNNIPQSEVNDIDEDEFTEDIMYFNMTGVSSAAGPVSVIFRHALSWITVNVKKSEGSPKIVIDEIKFTEVDSKGTGTVYNSVDDNEIKWVTEDNNDETVFGTDVELQESATKLVEPLFIPQTMNGKIVITYTIYSSPTEYFTETYTADLNSFKEKDSATTLTKWEPAKHYTYNIEIGTSEIFIRPTVAKWDEVVVPVDDLKQPAQSEDTDDTENTEDPEEGEGF